MANDLKGQQWWQEKIILLWDNQMTISIRSIGKSFELAYVCRWSKILLRACIKQDNVLTYLILRFIIDLRRISYFLCNCFTQRCVQCHLLSCAISAEWKLKHFINIYRYSSIPLLINGIHNTVFYSLASWKQKCCREGC